MAVDPVSGEVVVTGRYSNHIVLGAGEPEETLLTTVGDLDPADDIFLAKYAP